MENARFCSASISDCDKAAGLPRPFGPRRLRNGQNHPPHGRRRTCPRPARPPRITFFSDTCPKTCDRWARLGRVKLSLGSRKTTKRKRGVLARAGRQPRKPRFARAPHPPKERDQLVQSRAETEAAIAEARKSHERLRQA